MGAELKQATQRGCNQGGFDRFSVKVLLKEYSACGRVLETRAQVRFKASP